VTAKTYENKTVTKPMRIDRYFERCGLKGPRFPADATGSR